MTLRMIVEFVQLQLHVSVIVAVVRDQLMVEGKCLCIPLAIGYPTIMTRPSTPLLNRFVQYEWAMHDVCACYDGWALCHSILCGISLVLFYLLLGLHARGAQAH